MSEEHKPAKQKGTKRKHRVINPGKPYSSPELVDYGLIRNVTLGGTPGVGDSGNQGSENFP